MACAGCLFIVHPSQAQQGLGPFADFAEAEHFLAETYKAVMNSVPAEMREKLRASQRAWIKFKELDFVAQRSELKRREDESNEDESREEGLICFFHYAASETAARERQLRAFRNTAENADDVTVEQAAADRELTNTYQQCQSKLDPEIFSKLREAQRAWIAFRDLDLRVNPARTRQASLLLIRQRTKQLRAYLETSERLRAAKIEVAAAGVDQPEKENVEDKPDLTLPDIFERVR